MKLNSIEFGDIPFRKLKKYDFTYRKKINGHCWA